jgi:hypothetical protein
MYNTDKSKGKDTCSRCGGLGGSIYPTWMMRGDPAGICFRCHGSGVEPFTRKKREAKVCNSLRRENITSGSYIRICACE